MGYVVFYVGHVYDALIFRFANVVMDREVDDIIQSLWHLINIV